MKKASFWQTLLGIGATLFMIGALWWYQQREPQRLAAARQAVLARQLDEAMTLYAENCAVCHGAQGEGLGATPALNRADLREADPDGLFKVISRGLYNTAMPAWGLDDGGPLSDYQITELVSLIRYGDWQMVAERVAQRGRQPAEPFASQPDEGVLREVQALPQGEVLMRGLEVYARQCVACHGADGQGTSLAPALNTPAVRAKDPAEIERTIRYGVNGTLMAPWQGVLSEDEIAGVECERLPGKHQRPGPGADHHQRGARHGHARVGDATHPAGNPGDCGVHPFLGADGAGDGHTSARWPSMPWWPGGAWVAARSSWGGPFGAASAPGCRGFWFPFFAGRLVSWFVDRRGGVGRGGVGFGGFLRRTETAIVFHGFRLGDARRERGCTHQSPDTPD